jgi:hypothetical protein
MKIQPMGAKLFHVDKHDDTFHNSENAPKEA